MVVAVNTRLWIGEQLEGLGYFTREVCTHLCAQHPEHQFYFLFDRPLPPGLVLPANASALVIGPPARHPLLWKIWFDISVPKALKKIRADVFLSPDGQASLGTKVRQCVVLHDLAFLHHPEAYQKSHRRYYQYYTPRFVRKAASLAVVSLFTEKDVEERYGTSSSKFTIVYNGVKEGFRPLDWEAQAAIKDQYTGGKEFFLYVGAIQPRKNLVNLLKAFSIFKKRQKSEWKLVLAGRLAWKTGDFETLLSTYKYRDDVVLTGYLPEESLVQLTASAYALVYPSLFEGFGVPVVEGMRSGVPVLTSAATSMEEVAGEAALYFDPKDPADIADKMMRIYKDEPLRSTLVARGLERSRQFTWARTAELVWEAVERAVGS